MHPLIHVGFSLFIGLGFSLHVTKKYLTLLLSAVLINGFIDSDVLLIQMGIIDERIFQTGIVMIYVPMLILIGARLYERKRESSVLTRISLLLILTTLSHLIIDTVSGTEPVYLYYPISLSQYTFNTSVVPIAVILFILLIVSANFIETYIYNSKEGAKNIGESDGLPVLTRDFRGRIDRIKTDVDFLLKHR